MVAATQMTVCTPGGSRDAIEASMCHIQLDGVRLGLVTVELGATTVRVRARIAGEQFCKARLAAAGCDETVAGDVGYR
jgi:hypothetical protein